MLDRLRSVIIWLSFGVLLLGAAGYLFVLMGKGDSLVDDSAGTLAPVDFKTLSRSDEVTGFLMCPADLCRNALAEADAPLLGATPRVVRLAVADYADQSPVVSLRAMDPAKGRFTYLEKMPGASHPAVMELWVRPLDPNNDQPDASTLGKATMLVVYSYDPLGKESRADARDRAMRWVESIKETIETGRR
ncbi:hypothetical protein [Yunchengibacter salinarum]|uniref:hypothetical protein n=1 Tax=Yunchengibacter salinarum TaxID=3133399 RepID=UPI0035B695BC